MLNETTFKNNIMTWFEKSQREMPWRETTNPYYVWLSEVMLQQTQVKTVIDYYNKFIHRFPTIEALSEAKEDKVLKYWEDLGYYSRARNFHTAIKEVHHNYNAEVPSSPKVFDRLKGVGPYTQAAVMSIAFDRPLATVDGNVFRVWTRLDNDHRDIKLQSTRKSFERELEPFVQEEAGTFNQSVMELGAAICTPKNPLCLFYPVQENCEAFRKGTTLDLPIRTKKQAKEIINQKVFLVRNQKGQYLIEERQEKLLNDMWRFPMFESPNGIQRLENKLNHSLTLSENIVFQLKHQFTHRTWNLDVYSVIEDINIDSAQLPDFVEWFDLENRDDYSFPVSMNKIYEFIVGK